MKWGFEVATCPSMAYLFDSFQLSTFQERGDGKVEDWRGTSISNLLREFRRRFRWKMEFFLKVCIFFCR